MGVYVIRNSVPTPEEMGELLGVSSKRVSAVRSIMESPVKSRPSMRRAPHGPVARKAAKKTAKKAAKR